VRTIAFAALALLLLSAAPGIRLGVARPPYNRALLAAHKLTGVALAALCVIFFLRSVPDAGMTGTDALSAAALAASIVTLVATGAVLSGKAKPSPLLRILHAAAAGVLALSAGWKLIGFLF
jgi:hypothetical protein